MTAEGESGPPAAVPDRYPPGAGGPGAPRRPRRAAFIAAVVVVVVAAAGVVLVTGSGGERRDLSPSDRQAELRRLVPELQRFVESERGLRFKSPVKLTFLERRPFADRLRALDELETQDVELQERLLRALALVTGEVDLEAGDEVQNVDDIAAFYDTEVHELVLLALEPTPFVRSVVVHELTHALEDQHFGLDRDLLDDEVASGFFALIEGDALLVEERYVDSLSRGDRRRLDEEVREQSQTGDEGVPDVLIRLDEFPYVHGPPFVEALLEEGRRPRLDQAFASPPVASAQVMHPERYLAGQAPVAVPPPPAAGEVIDEGPIGEYLLSLVLATALDEQEAGRAAAGWSGDRYVVWADGPTSCVRATFATDTLADAHELREGLQRWADRHGGARVEGTGPVTLTRCG